MTTVLLRKLLRDIRLQLLVIALLLAAFECLWVKITERITGEIVPFLGVQIPLPKVQETIFKGPGKIVRTFMGGERIKLDRAMDVLSIGYVHPLLQTILCIWAIGRAAGAIAGEIDRGTMELLLAQPLARYRVVLAHFLVDLLTIPVLCLALWGGTWLGAWLVGPIHVNVEELQDLPFPVRVDPEQIDPEKLRISPEEIGPALVNVGALVFAVSGCTMWLSACGRFRWRVLGGAVLLMLLQFLLNLLGQMWEALAFVRPLTVFYYYQPQQIILSGTWTIDLSVWNAGQPLCHIPAIAVLFAVGLAGYALALWTFNRRDLPAPL
jgi:ABC-2 type transport system permease protein